MFGRVAWRDYSAVGSVDRLTGSSGPKTRSLRWQGHEEAE